MDPTKQYLAASPRNISADAFFASDRSTTTVIRSVTACDRPRPTTGTSCTNAESLDFAGWRNRFRLSRFSAVNPLPQQRKTAEGSAGVVDPDVRGWTHDVNYLSFASHSAASVTASTRVRVSILFGTGSEAYRHGLCGVVDVVSQPVILIVVPGIEPQYEITFNDPGGGDPKKLTANNRWGVGITEDSVKAIVAQHVDKDVGYDVVVCAGYSAGYLGLSGSIDNRLLSLHALERAVVFDCLYDSLGRSLSSLKQIKPSIQIVAYVASSAGNDFMPHQAPSFQSLSFGAKPYINYVNLFFNPNYYTAAAARVIGEGVSLADAPADAASRAGSPIITVLPKPFESALNDIAGRLPPRGAMISNPSVYKRVKGSVPSNGTPLPSFAAANASQITRFFSQTETIRQCIRNAQLLGWSAPAGEEWHDLLLIEFAWEYLV